MCQCCFSRDIDQTNQKHQDDSRNTDTPLPNGWKNTPKHVDNVRRFISRRNHGVAGIHPCKLQHKANKHQHHGEGGDQIKDLK